MGKRIKVRGNERVRAERDAGGVPHVYADDDADLYYGMGYCHAVDRGLQMQLMRLLGRGELARYLDSSDESVAIDTFFRRMNWSGQTEAQVEALPDDTRRRAEAYCAGANARFARKRPWELRLAGYKRYEPWTVHDSVLLSRMVGYLTLAQSQGEVERLLVEMIQAGADPAALEELFPGQLGGLDAERIDLIKRVALGERIVPESVRWGSAIPRMMASNNWVVAGSRTKSGRPILANDPHLETNRLPNVWCEIALHQGERYGIGATMPGLPGLIVGRTPDLAWGATYTFMDAIDSWIEHCKAGCYRRGDDEWIPFRRRVETIHRKKQSPLEVTFFENDHGVLDGDPEQEGYFLATRWASGESGSRSLIVAQQMWEAKTVAEGQALLGQIETAWNWVLADRAGNIGYQMSGMLPRRRAGVSGLLPLPGWDPDNDWQGIVPPEELPRVQNPTAGYFVTANQDLNAHGVSAPINVPMGDYRAARIGELLAQAQDLDVAGNAPIQYDLYSRQAATFLAILRPLLPETPQGKILAAWDCRYDPASQGAFLFEAFYAALLHDVFGTGGFGDEVGRHLSGETGIFCDFYANFDRVLLATESRWFNGEARDDLYRRVATDALRVTPKPWGSEQQIPLSHILFGGKMPRLFGFDRGPITVPGGRATPHQGQIYRSAGRLTSFTPSMRFITDLADDAIHSNLVGGPSDRRFSRWYLSDLANWQNQRYKIIRGK